MFVKGDLDTYYSDFIYRMNLHGFDKFDVNKFGSVEINGIGRDLDLIVLIQSEDLERFRGILKEEGYKADASYAIYEDGWGSFKRDEFMNIICYTNEDLYKKQLAAFKMCVTMHEISGKEVPKILRRSIHEFLRGEFDESQYENHKYLIDESDDFKINNYDY